MYAVSTCACISLEKGKKRQSLHTSSSTLIFFSAITCMRGSSPFVVSVARGKTTTALGSHEWFISATVGDTQEPKGARDDVETVNVLVVNWKISISSKNEVPGAMNKPSISDQRGQKYHSGQIRQGFAVS